MMAFDPRWPDDGARRHTTVAMANGANSYTNKPTDAMTFMYTVVLSTNYWLMILQLPSTAAAHTGAA